MSNLSGNFSSAWSSITSAVPGLPQAMGTIGVLLMAWAITKYLWQRKQGSGGNTSMLGWTAALGALMTAPNVIIPWFLKIVDLAINAVYNLFQI